MPKNTSSHTQPVKVLFVCMGNICRSPTAHGVFQKLVDDNNMSQQIYVDSAGTHAYHVGELPDPRSRETASGHGVDLSSLRARQAKASDFDEFDYVLAMDKSNYRDLKRICPTGKEHKLQLFLDYTSEFSDSEVPDPYYGAVGFERVFSLVTSASHGLLADIQQRWKK